MGVVQTVATGETEQNIQHRVGMLKLVDSLPITHHTHLHRATIDVPN